MDTTLHGRTSARNPGAAAFKSLFAELVEAVQSPTKLAAELYSKDIIPDTVLDRVLTAHGLSDGDRSITILKAVDSRLQASPSDFETVVNVLEASTSLGVARNFASELKEAHQRLRLEKPAAPVHSEPTSTNPETLSSSPTACDSTNPETAAAKKKRCSFPQLPTGSMTELERNLLEGRLSNENDEIQASFVNLVFRTCKSLNDRIELREVIFFLGQYQCVQQHEEVPKDYKCNLRKAKSVYDAFDAIQHFCSFFGYGLIKELVEIFGTDADKRRLAAYEDQFNKFCKRRVYECPIEAFESKRENEIHLVVKLKDEFENFSLKAVAKFRTKFSTILGVPDHALRFIGAAEGCIELFFTIPAFLEGAILPLSDQQKESLQKHRVIELRVEGGCTHIFNNTYDSQLETRDSECSLGKVCHNEPTRISETLSECSGLNGEEDNPGSAIFEAAASGDVAQITELLGKKEADVNAKYELGQTALMAAAHAGCKDTVQVLLARGASTNIQDALGQPALMWAARHGQTAIVEVLLASGASTGLQDERDKTALMKAAAGGHTGTVEVLLANAADPDMQDELGQTALMQAANEGHAELVEVLLASSADANLQDKVGETALRKAARGGHTCTVQILLTHGARANIQDSWSGTALIEAARGGHTTIVQALLARGADPNIEDDFGDTALLVAFTDAYEYDDSDNEVEKEIDEALIEALIEGGSDLNCQEQDTGQTPLFFAAERGTLSLVKLLLVGGADSQIRDKEGMTAFEHAHMVP